MQFLAGSVERGWCRVFSGYVNGLILSPWNVKLLVVFMWIMISLEAMNRDFPKWNQKEVIKRQMPIFLWFVKGKIYFPWNRIFSLLLTFATLARVSRTPLNMKGIPTLSTNAFASWVKSFTRFTWPEQDSNLFENAFASWVEGFTRST